MATVVGLAVSVAVGVSDGGAVLLAVGLGPGVPVSLAVGEGVSASMAVAAPDVGGGNGVALCSGVGSRPGPVCASTPLQRKGDIDLLATYTEARLRTAIIGHIQCGGVGCGEVDAIGCLELQHGVRLGDALELQVTVGRGADEGTLLHVDDHQHAAAGEEDSRGRCRQEWSWCPARCKNGGRAADRSRSKADCTDTDWPAGGPPMVSSFGSRSSSTDTTTMMPTEATATSIIITARRARHSSGGRASSMTTAGIDGGVSVMRGRALRCPVILATAPATCVSSAPAALR